MSTRHVVVTGAGTGIGRAIAIRHARDGATVGLVGLRADELEETAAAIDGPTHAYHLVPRMVSKGAAVAAHARARGYDPADCIAVGDSVEDLEVAAAVGRFFVVANGPERDPGLRAALSLWDNATVTEGSMGDGFYEAIVSTLVARR